LFNHEDCVTEAVWILAASGQVSWWWLWWGDARQVATWPSLLGWRAIKSRSLKGVNLLHHKLTNGGLSSGVLHGETVLNDHTLRSTKGSGIISSVNPLSRLSRRVHHSVLLSSTNDGIWETRGPVVILSLNTLSLNSTNETTVVWGSLSLEGGGLRSSYPSPSHLIASIRTTKPTLVGHLVGDKVILTFAGDGGQVTSQPCSSDLTASSSCLGGSPCDVSLGYELIEMHGTGEVSCRAQSGDNSTASSGGVLASVGVLHQGKSSLEISSRATIVLQSQDTVGSVP